MENNKLTTDSLSSFLSTPKSPTNLSFYDDVGEVFKISWGNGKIDVKYSDRIQLSEAANKFFEFLKVYIFHGYEIVERK